MKINHVAGQRLALLLPLVCATTALSGAATPSSASVTTAGAGPVLTAAAERRAVTLAPIATSIAITSNLYNPSPAGYITFTAVVTAASGPEVPGGVIAFTDWGRQIGVSTVGNDGSGSVTVGSLTDGLHGIKAFYIETPGFAASDSPAVYQLVQVD